MNEIAKRCIGCPYWFVLLLGTFAITGGVPLAKSEPVEPSDAIASDTTVTRRPAAAGGALAASPTANAPRLGLITPQYPEIPPAWSYNPYTAGLAPCPQREAGDPSCGDLMTPSSSRPMSNGVRF